MNQSALVTGALLAGFVLFLAARDRLTVYGDVLFGSAAAAPGGANVGGATTTAGNAPGSAGAAGSSGYLDDLLKWGTQPHLPSLPPLPDLGHLGF